MLNGDYKASIHHLSFAILLKVPISNFDICLIESIELFSSQKSSEKLQREGGRAQRAVYFKVVELLRVDGRNGQNCGLPAT